MTEWKQTDEQTNATGYFIFPANADGKHRNFLLCSVRDGLLIPSNFYGIYNCSVLTPVGTWGKFDEEAQLSID